MGETKKAKRFAIIDGKSVFYRGYYAMPNLSTKDGTPTGGIFGFATMALEVIRKLKPDYVAVAWDKPKTNIRKRLELYPKYKAGRKPPPPDFYEQIPVLHELLETFGWPLYEMDDYEADDIMGALAVQASKHGIETMLVTSDLDMLQLVNPLIRVFVLKKGLSNIELYSPKSFEAKYGIKAEQFLDLKSIQGDSSDNIPGVPGIGEKGAIELLKTFKTLDGVYDNLPLVKDSLRKKLEAGKDSAYLSKKLARIWTDAPIKLDLEAVDGTKAQPEKIQAMLQKLEFRNLAKQLPEIMHMKEPHEMHSVFSQGNGKNIIIDSAAKLKDLELPDTKSLVIYSRCAGVAGRNPVVLIVSAAPGISFTFDLSKLKATDLRDKLKGLLEDPEVEKVGYDIKSTIKAVYSLGINLGPVSHDVLVAAFLLNSLRREQTLTELAQVDLGYEGSPLEDLSNEELVHRAPEIMAIIRSLCTSQTKELASIPKLSELARDIEWPVIPVDRKSVV